MGASVGRSLAHRVAQPHRARLVAAVSLQTTRVSLEVEGAEYINTHMYINIYG